MSVRNTVTRQYQALANRAADQIGGPPPVPPEGWIATMRKALGMSGAQLARRLGVTRARVSQLEHAETRGGVSMKAMQAAAEALGCRLVYAIVPEGRIEDMIEAQARKKAKAIVETAGHHMALENQSLPESQQAEDVERITRDLMRTMPANLWADDK